MVMGLDNPIHIVFLVVILLLVFGAKRLPEIGRSLGGGMREFKDSVSGNQPAQQQPTLTQAAQQPQAPVAQPAPVQAPVAAPVPPAPPAPTQSPRLRSSRSPSTRPKPPGRYRACAPVLAGAQSLPRAPTPPATCAELQPRVQDRPRPHRFERGARDPLDLFQVFVVPARVGRAGDVPGGAVVGDDQP